METKELEKLSERRSLLAEGIMTLNIVDQITYNEAAKYSLMLNELKKTIETYFKPLKDQAYKAWKSIVDREKEELNKIIPLDEKLKREMTMYMMEQNRIKAEKERALQEELRRKEEENRLKIAEQLEKEGKQKEAETLLTQLVEVPKVEVIEEVPKVEGISYREDWDFEIEDETQIPRQFLIPNEKAIRAFIKSTKGKQPISGIKIIKKQVLVRR